MSSAVESAERFKRLYQQRKRSAQIGRRRVDPCAVHECKDLTRDYRNSVQYSWACTCGKQSRRWWADSVHALLSHEQHAARAARAAQYFDRQKARPASRGRLVDEHW